MYVIGQRNNKNLGSNSRADEYNNTNNDKMTATGKTTVSTVVAGQAQNRHQSRSATVRMATLNFNGIVLAICFAFLMLSLAGTGYDKMANCQEQLSIESRQQKDSDDLNDTIRYLEKLDKYFSQMSRPRFGRSEYKQPIALSSNRQQLFQTRPNVEYPARFASLADLINSQLARKYAEANY